MKKTVFAALAIFAFALVGTASAGDPMDAMVGKWTWNGFTVEVTKGGEHGLSAIVVDGPKNKGMQMIQSPLKPKDGAFVGRVMHPMTGKIYNAQMTMPAPDTWAMNGCTDDGACAKGEFKKVQ